MSDQAREYIRGRCPVCNAKYRTPVGGAGRRGRCPSCRKMIRVPITAGPARNAPTMDTRAPSDDVLLSNGGDSGAHKSVKRSTAAGASRPSEAESPHAIVARIPTNGITAVSRFGSDYYEAGAEAGESGPVQPMTLSAIRRFRGTFLAIFLTVASGGIAISWLAVKPKYQATATVEVKPTTMILYRTNDPRYHGNYVRTEAKRVGKQSTLDEVLAREDVKSTDWYSESPQSLIGSTVPREKRLREALEVSIQRDSYLIDIAVTAAEAGDAMVLTNAVCDAYLADAREESGGHKKEVEEILVPRENELMTQIKKRLDRRADKLTEIGAASPEQLLEIRGARLDELKSERDRLLREIERLDWELERLGPAPEVEAEADEGANEMQPPVSFAEDGEWVRLEQSRRAAERSLERAGDRFGKQHPTYLAQQDALDLADENLRARERYLSSHPPLPAASDADAGLVVTLSRETLEQQRSRKLFVVEQLKTAIERAERELVQDVDSAVELQLGSDEQSHDQQELGRIRDRLNQVKYDGKPFTIQAYSAAVLPTKPSNWKRPYLFSAMAIFGGLVLGFVTANWRAIRTPAAAEFSRRAGTSVLGIVPAIRPAQRRLPEWSQVEQESIRFVRTALLQRLNGDHGNAVLITSAGPGAGKTGIAVKLAQSFANAGRRVLVVDADLRKPALAERFEIHAELGLSDVLAGRVDDAHAIAACETPGLSILPAGRPVTGGEVELLANGAFAACLERWRADYDLVLLDTCPVLTFADTQILLGAVGGVILVAREGRCRQNDLTDALACIAGSGGTLLGTVFITSSKSRAAYGREYAQQYYAEHAKRAPVAPEPACTWDTSTDVGESRNDHFA